MFSERTNNFAAASARSGNLFVSKDEVGIWAAFNVSSSCGYLSINVLAETLASNRLRGFHHFQHCSRDHAQNSFAIFD